MDTKLRQAALNALQEICGSAHVKMTFDGGGDDGQVNGIAVAGLLDEDDLRKIPVPAAARAAARHHII